MKLDESWPRFKCLQSLGGFDLEILCRSCLIRDAKDIKGLSSSGHHMRNSGLEDDECLELVIKLSTYIIDCKIMHSKIL